MLIAAPDTITRTDPSVIVDETLSIVEPTGTKTAAIETGPSS